MAERGSERTPTGYATKQESIPIAGADDLVVCSLLDRQQYADPDGKAMRRGISPAAWPLFGVAWPSGAELAARLAQRDVDRGERILELGCGLALASLVAHRRGADVTASDCHPLAALFLERNVGLNGLAPLKYRHGDWADTGNKQPEPGDAEPGRVEGTYELLVGSDVLYERDANAALAGFIGRHAAARAEVWIVDPDRGNRPPFCREMQAMGFSLHEERLDHVASTRSGAYKGRLMVFRRGGPRRASSLAAATAAA
ncbi:MAG: SAM-dependent methyltransferase [Burkholderiaceae bacterium]